MELKTLTHLLNRAAAALETPGDLSVEEKHHLIEDLTVGAKEILSSGTKVFPKDIPEITDGTSKTYQVKVTQVLHTQRSLVATVESDSPEDAVEAVSNGEIDLPSEDSAWQIDSCKLTQEDHELA